MKSLVPTGRPEALVALAETAVPEPQPDEALVKVEAFSVNRGEIFQLEQPRPGALHDHERRMVGRAWTNVQRLPSRSSAT
jgi:NADPH:quinone reductase-like Zn-dependent oxidoreductase